MYFCVPTLTPEAGDRKAQYVAKAGALASAATRRAPASGVNPEGKLGRGPATSLQAAGSIDTAARPAPSCRTLPQLSWAR